MGGSSTWGRLASGGDETPGDAARFTPAAVKASSDAVSTSVVAGSLALAGADSCFSLGGADFSLLLVSELGSAAVSLALARSGLRTAWVPFWDEVVGLLGGTLEGLLNGIHGARRGHFLVNWRFARNHTGQAKLGVDNVVIEFFTNGEEFVDNAVPGDGGVGEAGGICLGAAPNHGAIDVVARHQIRQVRWSAARRRR